MSGDGMLIFINVGLGGCIIAGVATIIGFFDPSSVSNHPNAMSEGETLILIFLGIIYLTNVIRGFLGFIKFYTDDLLYERKVVENIKEKPLLIIRAVDFAVVILTIVSLLISGFVIKYFKVFTCCFFISSVMFIGRNVVVKKIFKRQSSGVYSTWKIWMAFDIIFFLLSILLLMIEWELFYLYPSVSLVLYGAVCAVCLLLNVADIIINCKWYFASKEESGKMNAAQ
jgi:hypothetical protein